MKPTQSPAPIAVAVTRYMVTITKLNVANSHRKYLDAVEIGWRKCNRSKAIAPVSKFITVPPARSTFALSELHRSYDTWSDGTSTAVVETILTSKPIKTAGTAWPTISCRETTSAQATIDIAAKVGRSIFGKPSFFPYLPPHQRLFIGLIGSVAGYELPQCNSSP